MARIRKFIGSKSCEQCGSEFSFRDAKQRYCSRDCSHKARLGPQTERTCPGCRTVWSAPVYNPSTYCSKKCIFESGAWASPRESQCAHCKKPFISHRKPDHVSWEKYCSNECRGAGAVRAELRKCVACGSTFTVKRNHIKLGWNRLTCSLKCRNTYFAQERSAMWNGGEYFDHNGYKRRYGRREGYPKNNKYEAEHRLIAGKAIGRPVRRGEVVTFIDRDITNLDPDNLFLCHGYGEFHKRRTGKMPWPTHSNLEEIARREKDA